MLLSLAALAALVGFLIPGFFGRHGVTLDNASILLARELRGVQNWSAYMREPARVIFDEGGDGYRAIDSFGLPVQRSDGTGPYMRRFSIDGVFEGVRIVEADFGGDGTLRYSETGAAAEGGTAVIEFRGKRAVLTIEAGSGLVAIDGLSRKWQDSGR